MNGWYVQVMSVVQALVPHHHFSLPKRAVRQSCMCFNPCQSGYKLHLLNKGHEMYRTA